MTRMSILNCIRRLFGFKKTDQSPDFAGMTEYGEEQLRDASDEEVLRMLHQYTTQLERQLAQLDIESDMHRVQNATNSPSPKHCQVAFTTTDLGGVEATCIELTAFIKEFKYRSCDDEIDFETLIDTATDTEQTEPEPE